MVLFRGQIEHLENILCSQRGKPDVLVNIDFPKHAVSQKIKPVPCQANEYFENTYFFMARAKGCTHISLPKSFFDKSKTNFCKENSIEQIYSI